MFWTVGGSEVGGVVISVLLGKYEGGRVKSGE